MRRNRGGNLRAGRRGVATARACAVVLLFVLAGSATARPGDGASQDASQAAEPLRDPDFGVITRHPGLQRHVEMYQWTRAGSGYALAWRGARVDSSGFAPGHANPRDIPLREREWRAPVLLEGKPVPRDVVDALARWQPFRPNFSALPGNMSATFQPEGDGLGSAENPLDPQLGDLRITWRQLVLSPPDGRLVLRDGEWALREPGDTPPVVDTVADAPAQKDADSRRPRWPFVVVPILVVLVVMVVALRRRRSSAD